MALLKATKRTEVGTHKVRRLRGKGEVPAVVYGHGEETMPITLSQHDIELAVLHGERLLELRIGDKKENVLIKEVQYDTFGQQVLHVDLTRVSLDERVELTVPIILRGTPVGTVDGGVLQQLAAQVTIECVVTAIPDDVKLSVADMKVGDMLHMKNLLLPEGAKLLSDPELAVCTLSMVAEEEVAPAPAEAAAAVAAAVEPEVIGEKKEEEEPAEEEPEKKKETDRTPRA
jgi:large subunit ribosomal protein L25